jgi:hypothetical protein
MAVRLRTDDANAPINRRFFKSLGKKKGAVSRSKPIETILVFVQQRKSSLSPFVGKSSLTWRWHKIDAALAGSCLGEHVTTREGTCNPNEWKGADAAVSKQSFGGFDSRANGSLPAGGLPEL